MSFFDFHVHSHYSRDANMVPDRLIRVALKQGLRGIAITDHNTIAGGVQARKTCGRPFVVVVGAEIRTDACEIIGLFLTDEISSTDHLTVIDEPHVRTLAERLEICLVKVRAGPCATNR